MPIIYKVLICEDNPMTLKLLEFALKGMGFHVMIAPDGEAGIKILNENEIDLVVSDINMPYNNGLELIQYIRRHVKIKIPIIIVSNINVEDTVKLAAELGADAYLSKPINLKRLDEVVHSFDIIPKLL